MTHKGKIFKVYYFSPHRGLLSKIVLEVELESGGIVKVEKIDTQEGLANEFGFQIKEPHVWDTRGLDNKTCIVEVTEEGTSISSLTAD